MNITVSAICDKGMVRNGNEDAVLVNTDILRDAQANYNFNIEEKTKPFLIAVADGMGGHAAGEVASSYLVSSLSEKVLKLNQALEGDAIKQAVGIWVGEIHEDLLSKGRSAPELNGMGSTLIGLLFYSQKIFSINVGDSRLYRYRNGILAKLSKDHSLREVSGDEEAPSNIILNSFGGGKTIYFDFEELTSRIAVNDILLLCSDGLSSELNDDVIEHSIDKDLTGYDLVEMAKIKGGKDNISVILIKIISDNEKQ